MAAYVDVNPKLLRWAVDRSGLPLPSFDALLPSWLSGERKPTYNQLKRFAQRAMVPFGYLFLQQPPNEQLPLPDFRTRTDKGVRQPTPNLIETIFEMQQRQDWMREYLTEEGHGSLPFVGAAQIGDPIESVARQMRTTLHLSEDWAEGYNTWQDSLRFLRERIEEAGILIFVNGIVGNNTHRKLDPDEFQGFVLVDRIVPLIFVNGADFKVAQMFTIAHELAHVWIAQSALFELSATNPADNDIEKYCNSVAAEFLVSNKTLLAAWPKNVSVDVAISLLARRFKVSQVVLARRARDCRIISTEAFFDFYNRQMQRERANDDRSNSGGDFWRTQNVRLGRRFGAAVIAAVEDGRITYTDAFELTRLYGDTFDKFASQVRQDTIQ